MRCSLLHCEPLPSYPFDEFLQVFYCQSYFDLVTFYDPSPVFSSSSGLKLAWPDPFDDSEPQNPRESQQWHIPDFAITEEGRAEEHL